MRAMTLLVAVLIAVLCVSSADAVERHRERDHSTVAAPDTAAPRGLTLAAAAGAVVDNAVYHLKFANSFRVRGITTSIVAAGSECTLTLTINGTTVNVFSLVGKAGSPNYIPLNNIEVPANKEITLRTDVTGTNTGLVYILDTIP